MRVATFRSRNCLSASAILVLACFAGCYSRPNWGVQSYDRFRQTHIQTIFAPKSEIRLWFDVPDAPMGGMAGLGTAEGLLTADNRTGYVGSAKLHDGRVLSYHCLTMNGVDGTLAFKLDEKLFPDEKPYQLRDGRLFLISAKDKKIEIKQIDREIRDAANKSELDELVRANPTIASFIANAAKGK